MSKLPNMCGRVVMGISPGDMLREMLELGAIEPELAARYNAAPTDPIPVVRSWGTLETMRWGLTMPDRRAVGVNVRIESLSWKVYRENLRLHRCLIVVDAFYEWQSIEGRKVPHLIHRDDGRPLVFAGFHDADGCCVITKPAEGVVAALHDRMPAMLERDAWKAWLDPNLGDVLPVLEAAGSNGLAYYPVSTRVNSVRNDDEYLVKRVDEREVPSVPLPPPKKQLGLF